MPMSRIEKDLGKKLTEDIQRACSHFADMCDIADIDDCNQYATIMYVFSNLLVIMAQSQCMAKEDFTGHMGKIWDQRKETHR